MSKVTDSIGLKYERHLEDSLSDLICTSSNLSVPDFYNSNLNFWIEAKVGNVLWGPRIKEYQVKGFRDLEAPVFYALGFHNFHDAGKRLIQKTERGRQSFLDKNMKILETYFISDELIEKIWDNEGRISANTGYSYCMVKKGILNNIFQNRKFKRSGVIISSPELFYGYNKEDFLVEQFDTGGVFLRKKDEAVVD
jgi:hypothetical protein